MLAARPDAVLVVTAPAAHAACIRPFLEAGIPVFTEKPLATDPAESRALVALAQARDVNFQVGFELRYCGLTRAMKQVVESGRLGRPVKMCLVQISGCKPTAGYMTLERTGGIFYEKLCHQIDIFRYWLGEPTRIMAHAGPPVLKHYGIPDNATAVLEFSNGRCGAITFSATRAAHIGGLNDHPDRGHYYEMVLTCERGALAFNGWTEAIDVVEFNHREDLKTELVERIDVREQFGEPVYDLVTQDGDFLESVRHRRPPTHPASDAQRSMEWVEKAEESLRRHGEWIA